MIVEGLLPVTQEQAITMAALQLHIQSLCGEQHLKQTTSSGIRGSFRKRLVEGMEGKGVGQECCMVNYKYLNIFPAECLMLS